MMGSEGRTGGDGTMAGLNAMQWIEGGVGLIFAGWGAAAPVRLDGSMSARLYHMRVRSDARAGYGPPTRQNNLLTRLRAGEGQLSTQRASCNLVKVKWIDNEESLLDSNWERKRNSLNNLQPQG